MLTWTARIIVLLVIGGQLCTTSAQPGGGAGGGGAGGTPQPKPDAVHDIVGRTFTASPVVNGSIPATLDDDLAALAAGNRLTWGPTGAPYAAGETLYDLVKSYQPVDNTGASITSPPPACATTVAVWQTYVFHVSHWMNNGANRTADNAPTLVSSDWYVYRHPRHLVHTDENIRELVKADLTGAGDPFIYGATKALVVSIDRFDKFSTDTDEDKSRSSGRLSNTYSLTVTQGTPANRADAGALFSALTGISSGSAFMAAGGTATYRLYVGAACQQGTKSLPYTMSISDSILQKPATDDNKSSSPQAPSPGNVVCSGPGNTTPCAVNRTLTSLDKEYWDFGIGLMTPGVRETKYTWSTTSNSVMPNLTRHTDLYALADIFPFGYLVPKESVVPHIVAGIPVTSQSLYRPYFGLGENLTGWTGAQKALSLPVGVNFIGGVTYMKTQHIVGPTPTTQAEFNSELKTYRVWKGVFGIEVPVSSIASKLGGKGGSSSKSANGTGKGGS